MEVEKDMLAASEAEVETQAPLLDPNPPRGNKGDFRKLTITLPQWAYKKLVEESARRKVEGAPNHMISALLREAVAEYLMKLGR